MSVQHQRNVQMLGVRGLAVESRRKGWNLLCRWSNNGCCFISEQAGSDSSGKRWFIDHSHCHGVSKLAHGRSERTGRKQKKEREKKKRRNLQSKFKKDLEILFCRKKHIAAALKICFFLSLLIYSASNYHLPSLIRTYCTRSGLMKLSQR